MRDNDGKGKEISAGGVVLRDGKMLLIQVRNLAGERLWTFPKGHPEKGEAPRKAALREVEEETGWKCRILGRAMTACYRFKRDGRPISKRVLWYWMAPKKKTGKPDPDEVLAAKWAGPGGARKRLRYPSDMELLGLVERRVRRSGE